MINTAIAVGLPFGQLTLAQRATALLRSSSHLLTEASDELATESNLILTLVTAIQCAVHLLTEASDELATESNLILTLE